MFRRFIYAILASICISSNPWFPDGGSNESRSPLQLATDGRYTVATRYARGPGQMINVEAILITCTNLDRFEGIHEHSSVCVGPRRRFLQPDVGLRMNPSPIFGQLEQDINESRAQLSLTRTSRAGRGSGQILVSFPDKLLVFDPNSLSRYVYDGEVVSFTDLYEGDEYIVGASVNLVRGSSVDASHLPMPTGPFHIHLSSEYDLVPLEILQSLADQIPQETITWNERNGTRGFTFTCDSQTIDTLPVLEYILKSNVTSSAVPIATIRMYPEDYIIQFGHATGSNTCETRVRSPSTNDGPYWFGIPFASVTVIVFDNNHLRLSRIGFGEPRGTIDLTTDDDFMSR